MDNNNRLCRSTLLRMYKIENTIWNKDKVVMIME